MNRKQFFAVLILSSFIISIFGSMFPLFIQKNNNLFGNPTDSTTPGGLDDQNDYYSDSGNYLVKKDVNYSNYKMSGTGNNIAVYEQVDNSSSGEIGSFHDVRSDGFIDYCMITSYDAAGFLLEANFLSNDPDERRFSDLNDQFPLPYSENTFGAARKIGRFQNIWTPWKSDNWYIGIDVFERNDAGTGELEYITYYCAFIINSSTTRVVDMLVGSDDEIWVFKDGQLIFNHTTGRALVQDDDSITITLNPGPNGFLVKVHEETGETGWCMRFNQSGSAITTGIKVGITKTDELSVKIPAGWIDKIGSSSISITELYETGNWIYELSPDSWSMGNGGDTTDISKSSSTDNFYTSTDDGTTSLTITLNGFSGTVNEIFGDSSTNPGWTRGSSRVGWGYPNSGDGWTTSTSNCGHGHAYYAHQTKGFAAGSTKGGVRWYITVPILSPRDWEATNVIYYAYWDTCESGAENGEDYVNYYLRWLDPNDQTPIEVDNHHDSIGGAGVLGSTSSNIADLFNSYFGTATSIILEIGIDIYCQGNILESADNVYGNIYYLYFSLTYTKKINKNSYLYIYKNSMPFVGRQIPPTKATLYFAYKRVGSLSSLPNSYIRTYIDGSEITSGRIYTSDIDTSWKVAALDVTSSITSSAVNGIEVKIGFYIFDEIVLASTPQILLDAIRLEIVVLLDPGDSNIGMYIRNLNTLNDFQVSGGTYGSGSTPVSLGGNTRFVFRFTGSVYQISFDYDFQTTYERNSYATTNYTVNSETGEIVWWIYFDPVDVDTTLSDINTYEFTYYIPRDWTIDPTGVWRPGEGFGVDSTPLQITEPTPGDNTKKSVRFYGEFPNGIMYNPFPVTKRDGRWELKCYGVNYITTISSSAGTTLNPTNSTTFQITINQPSWTAWITSQGNLSIYRVKNEYGLDTNELWNLTILNSITTTSLNIVYNFNITSVGKYMVIFSWKSENNPEEVGFNYIFINVIRKTHINLSELIISNRVILDGTNVTFTLPWWDNILIPPNDNNVSDAIPWIEIYGDQQGNLTNKYTEDPGTYGWLTNLGEPYNGSNPEVINTYLTDLIFINEAQKGNYTFQFNTSELVNRIGPGNRTLRIEFNKPYHYNVSFLLWIFIISDTQMEWVDISMSSTDPKFAETLITQGNSEYIKFRFVDLSRRRYENNYKNDINTDPFECIYLNNDTKITNGRMIVHYETLNKSSWIEPAPRPRIENITFENKDSFGINFKVSFQTPATDHNENLFYYFNFTIDVKPDNETRFQSAWCVNVSQAGLPSRLKMTGCLRIDVGTAKNTIQTVLALNNTLNMANKTWDESLRVDVKWNDSSVYNHSSGFCWNKGILTIYLVFINDTTVTSGSSYPIPNGSAFISNMSGTHLGNVSFEESGWTSRGGAPIKCRQVGPTNYSLYRFDINVTSVPTIFSSEVGTEYDIKLKLSTISSFKIQDSRYNWEEAVFSLKLIVLPNDAEVSLEYFTPDRNNIYWGDYINVTFSYIDTTNNVPITNKSGSVDIAYEILYYIGGTPYIIFSGYLKPSNQSIYPGQYYSDTIDTNDPQFADNFSIPVGQTSREFYIKVYATDIGFTTPTPSPDRVIHKHTYYTNQWSFFIKARTIDMLHPVGSHLYFTGWSGTAEIVRNDLLNFTVTLLDDSPRPIDVNISLRAPIGGVNVSWIIPEWFGLPVYKGWALTDANGSVSFSVPTYYPALQYDRPYEVQVSFKKQNYASYSKSFLLKIVRIPVLIEWAGKPPGCTQGDKQEVRINLWDYAYNEHRALIYGSNIRVYCRVKLGPEVVYEEFQLESLGNGTYIGEINTWPSLFSWLEAKAHEIEFRVELPDQYVSVPYGTRQGDATILFNIDSAGPFGPLTMPILIIMSIVGAIVGVYLGYKSYKFLTTPYPIRKINESINKIKKNKKVASGVMKSRDHLIYLEMVRRYKLIGITPEAPPKEKLEPIWEPSILKKEKEELIKKLPEIPMDLIERELKAAGISDDELPIYMSQIKELDIVDRHEFISSLVGEERWAQIEEELRVDLEKIEPGKGAAEEKETKKKKK